jgi:hypothetical protein
VEASPGTIAPPADKRDAADSAVGILLPAVTTNGVLDRLDGIDMAAGDVIFSRLCVDDGSAVGVLPDLALADPGSDANDAVLQAVWSEWAPGTC